MNNNLLNLFDFVSYTDCKIFIDQQDNYCELISILFVCYEYQKVSELCISLCNYYSRIICLVLINDPDSNL